MTNAQRKLLGAIALLLLCLIVFGNTLGHEFVYDDMKVIVENPHIQDFGGSLSHLFDRSYFQISGGEASYRPVPTFSYYLLYRIFGLDPLGYHLFSLLLHAANAALVFLLFGALPIRRWAALSGAALFAVHPVVTEAVNCISFNEDLLVTFFYLTSLLAVICSEQKTRVPGLGFEWVAWVAFALALLSKEMALTLPLVAYLQHVVFQSLPGSHSIFRSLFESLRLRLRLYLGYLVLVVGYLYVRFFSMAGTSDSAVDGVPLLQRLLFVPYQILGYLRLTIFPFDLSAEYVHAYPQRFFAPANLVALVLIGAIVTCAWLARKKAAALTFGIGWFLISLTPVLNLYELVNPTAERYLYLPVIGAVMAIVSGIWAAVPQHATARRKWVRPVMPALLICLLTVSAVFSFYRNRVWRDNFTLFSETAEKVPDSPRVRGGLGLAYQQMDRLPEAAREFERAIELNPRLVDAHFSLAYVYEKSGRTEEAIAAYERVVRLDPGFRDVYFNLAGLYVKKGRLEAARQAYSQHIERQPDDIEARNNLGVVYAMLDRLAEAEAQWRQVLVLSPDNQSARDNIAKLAAVKSGRQPE